MAQRDLLSVVNRLKTNDPSLICLDLSGTNLRNEDAKDLSIGLERNAVLTELDLRMNKIGNEGVHALSTAIIDNSTLLQLDLRYNWILAQGAQALSLALVQNKCLTCVDLGVNNIGQEGGEAIFSALQKNSTLTQLDLTECNISKTTLDAIASKLSQNKEGQKERLDQLRAKREQQRVEMFRKQEQDRGRQEQREQERRFQERKERDRREQEKRRQEDLRLIEARKRIDEDAKRRREQKKAQDEELVRDVRTKELERITKPKQNQRDNLLVEMDQLQVFEKDKIGEGSFGVIFKGSYQGIIVAVKKIKEQRLMTEAMIKEFETEVRILDLFKHPNIVFFMGITLDHGIVFEFCPNGDLYQSIHQQKKIYSVPEVILIARGIAAGLCHLHHKFVIHRDIKSRNILLDSSGSPKITDFGMSKTKSSMLSMTFQKAGTPLWMAPEVIRAEEYNTMADVYSFALVVWEMLSNEIPYGLAYPVLFKRVGQNGERPIIPKKTPLDLAELIRACWSQDMNKRPGMKTVFEALDQLAARYPQSI